MTVLDVIVNLIAEPSRVAMRMPSPEGEVAVTFSVDAEERAELLSALMPANAHYSLRRALTRNQRKAARRRRK